MTYDATANLNHTYDQENRIGGAGGFTYICRESFPKAATCTGSAMMEPAWAADAA